MKTAWIALALLAGCSPVTVQTRPLSEQQLREIADEVGTRDVIVEFGPLPADRHKGSALKVGRDSTTWQYRDEQKVMREMKVPTDAIADIVVIRRGAGAGIGFLIGASAGALGGAGVALAQSCTGSACDGRAVGPALIGGLVAGLVGAIVGASSGYKTQIDFADTPPPRGVRESTPAR